MLTVPDDVMAEADRFHAKLAHMPRMNFGSRLQVRFLRVLMAATAPLLSPARRAAVTVRKTVIEADGRRVHLRILEPRGRPTGIVVDMHGGAWTIMRAINDDPLTVPMAEEGFVVIGVDYPLAPECPFDDVVAHCAAALAWTLDEGVRHYGADHVLLHGDSAGAHLCLASALRCRDLPSFDRLLGMVLFFGAFDLSGTPSLRAAGKETVALYGPSLRPFFGRITGRIGEAALRDPAISPLYADLAGLPPALLIVGTADPLLDDSLMLAERLRAQGSPADITVISDAPHAFNRMPTRLAELANAYARAWMAGRKAQGPRRPVNRPC